MTLSASIFGLAVVLLQSQPNETILYMACEKATAGSQRSITQVFSVRSGWGFSSGGDRGFELEKTKEYEASVTDQSVLYDPNSYYPGSFRSQFGEYSKSLRHGDGYCKMTTERIRIENWYRSRMADGRYEAQSLADWRPSSDSYLDVASWENLGQLRGAKSAPERRQAQPPAAGVPSRSEQAATAKPAPAEASELPRVPRMSAKEADEDFARKKAEHELKLAAHRRELEAFEKAQMDVAAKKASNAAAAKAAEAKFAAEQADHAERAAEASRLQAEWAMRASGQFKPEDEVPVEFKEGVVLCKPTGPDTASFSCQGPLQNVSTRLEVETTTSALGMACGSAKSIRDLGMVAGYRAFGCGFGIHPTARDYPGNTDVAAKLGIDFIPGRGAYSCPKSRLAYCR